MLKQPTKKLIEPDNDVPIKTLNDVDNITHSFVAESGTLVDPVVDLNQRLQEFRDYLRGESVAIVGRAGYLTEYKLGEFIDSHDVVIRIHTWHIHGQPQHFEDRVEYKTNRLSYKRFVPARYQINIGSRTDVLYLRLQWLVYADMSQIFDQLTHDGTSWIGVETFTEMRDGAPQHHYIEKNYMPVHIIPIDFFGSLSARLNYSHPLPGTLVSAFVAQTEASKIFIVGCPCYQDKKGKEEHAKLELIGRHKTLTDFHYLRQLVGRDDRVTCDEVMQKLFETEVS